MVWTRRRQPPDLLPQICDWFAARGFEPRWVSDPAAGWGVAAHRFAGVPAPLERAARMFNFISDQTLKDLRAERSRVPAPA